MIKAMDARISRDGGKTWTPVEVIELTVLTLRHSDHHLQPSDRRNPYDILAERAWTLGGDMVNAFTFGIQSVPSSVWRKFRRSPRRAARRRHSRKLKRGR